MYCECGCGEKTPLVTKTSVRDGWVRGEPKRFIKGHNARGRVVSQETKDKIRAIRTGRKHTEETKRRISASVAGDKHNRFGKMGSDSPSYRGGRLMRFGYVHVLVSRDHPMADSKSYALEHRLVMATHLGRTLTSDEIVHHENEIKDDNRIENLRLFPNAQAHIRHHRAKG